MEPPEEALIKRLAKSQDAWCEERLLNFDQLTYQHTWLAYDQKPLGIICFSSFLEVLDIHFLAVDEMNRKKGVASFLLETLLTYAYTYALSDIFLEVSIDNHIAQRLYKRLGFVENRVRNHYYKENGKFVDAIEYHKRIV